MEKQTSNRLDQYLEAFGQRLKKLTLLQGIAATAVVLLVVAVIGAWFSTESGFSSTPWRCSASSSCWPWPR
jgi:hypothetical protein